MKPEFDFTKEGICEQCGFENSKELTEYEASIQMEIAKAFSDYIGGRAVVEEVNLWRDGAKMTQIIEDIVSRDPRFARVLAMQYARMFFDFLFGIQRAIDDQKEKATHERNEH